MSAGLLAVGLVWLLWRLTSGLRDMGRRRVLDGGFLTDNSADEQEADGQD